MITLSNTHLDLVRDGGQVSIISSIGTMDKRTDNVLQEIKTNTHFLGGSSVARYGF